MRREIIATIEENPTTYNLPVALNADGKGVYLVGYSIFNMSRNVPADAGTLTIAGTDSTPQKGYYERAELVAEIEDNAPAGTTAEITYDGTMTITAPSGSDNIVISGSRLAQVLGISAGTYTGSVTGSNPVALHGSQWIEIHIDELASQALAKSTYTIITAGAPMDNVSANNLEFPQVSYPNQDYLQQLSITLRDQWGSKIDLRGSKAMLRLVVV